MALLQLHRAFAGLGVNIGIACLSVCISLGCGQRPQPGPEGPYWVDDDRRNIDEPESRDPNLVWQTIDRSTFDQIRQFLDLERSFSKLIGRPRQSDDINSFDEVPNSSWFTNRHGLETMTAEEISRGPATTDGPDQSGPWLVFRPKVQGATPGFWIEDVRGDQYIIKFDPTGHPELSTGAAAISSRYFHACGYNVPQETIVYWRPEILKIKDGVKFTDSDGKRRTFTETDLQEILGRVHHLPDGTIRSLASLSLGTYGKIKGPFSYSGRRQDDANDWFQHEHRRILRGLYVIASLVNHYDAKDQNTLDVFVEEGGNRFLKHFLIDFGSTLGADGMGPKIPIKGYANVFDTRDVLVSAVTLGTKLWPWERAREWQYPSVGYFESEIFHPNKFDPIYPNPAFENRTDRDAYWAAKIVMAFRDEHLRALVRTGQLSNPEAEEYLLKTLIERRDKIGRHWFGKVNPLDHFRISRQSGSYHVRFDDLAVKYDLESDDAVYRYRVLYRNKELFDNREIGTADVVISADELNLMAKQLNSSGSDEQPFEILIETSREKNKWSRPTRLWLWYGSEKNNLELVGVEHLD